MYPAHRAYSIDPLSCPVRKPALLRSASATALGSLMVRAVGRLRRIFEKSTAPLARFGPTVGRDAQIITTGYVSGYPIEIATLYALLYAITRFIT